VLRDYLFIPLGGSRGSTWKTYRNLMITMLLGGLWHGANWTFVVWGGYHGLLLCLHRSGAASWAQLPAAVRRVATFALVVIGWVFFRAASLPAAFTYLGAMFRYRPGLPSEAPLFAALVAAAGLMAHLGPNSFELPHRWRPTAALGMAVLFILCLTGIYTRAQSPFLYFQF
jgi:alginate O-acetyltransferase complex protein AlgI